MKLRKILEYVWLGVALLCLLISIRYTYRVGWDGTLKFYLLTAISFLMYLFRRMANQKAEKD
jgi:hypothetical protein